MATPVQAKTRTATVNTSYSQILATIPCDEIIVGEDPSVVGWPTTDFRIKMPDNAATPIQISTGGSWIFNGPFIVNDSVCFLATVAGSTTFKIIERRGPLHYIRGG